MAAAIGLGSAQAALAAPVSGVVDVACNAIALASDITANTGGETLSLAKFCIYKLPAGLPHITEDLTINGNQGTIERSYAPDTPGFSILTVKADIDLVLNHVNLRNGGGPGAGFGGAIDIEKGNVTVNGGILSDNTSTHDGGAIANKANLTVNGASFTGNSSLYGGGIYNRSKGSATVTGSAFTRNSAAKRAGAIFNGRSDVLAVTGSGFYQNQAKYGGGIYNRDESTVTDSLIVGNTATSGGGGIYNDGDSTITLTSTSVVGNRPGNCEPVNTIAGCTG